MIDQVKPRSCSKPCIANVGGHCAVQTCGGPIIRMAGKHQQDLGAAARRYCMAKAAFADYFGEGYIDDDTD